MSSTIFRKKNIYSWMAIIAVMLLATQPVISQPLQKKGADSVKTILNDTLLPNLLIKIETYTATIDHTDFLIRRKFNTTPISLDLPAIEKKVNAFKKRLDKKGSQMNFRGLNSGMIMLNEVVVNLSAYQRLLIKYSNELTLSNAEVKKILHDPILNLRLTDQVLMQQLGEIKVEGIALDALQQKTLMRVNLLRNRVSVSLLQATDIISDMRYLTIALKMGMWNQEEQPLFKARPSEYQRPLGEITKLGLVRAGKIVYIYLNEKWNVLTIGLLVFIFILSWLLLNMRRIKKQTDVAEVLAPLHFLNRSILVGCAMALFTYLPYFFVNPPMSFIHACELLRLALLIFLIYPYLTRQSKITGLLLCLLWIIYVLDDNLLDSAYGERWGLFLAGILMAAVLLKIIISKQPVFKNLPESPATRALAIFSLALALLSIIFNVSGRLTLAKILGASAIQCLMLGISLKVFCTMVLEAIYLQSEAYHESRFSDFINFKILQHRILKILWILSCIVFAISLIHGITLYDVMLQALDNFFSATRKIGNMVFTFESVAVFICIIWLSSVLSSFINFFFGNEGSKNVGKRSKVGSMMLLIRLTIWTLGFGIAVAAAGIPLDKLSIMIGALGIGIGFGLQNIVNNLVSGVILAFERPIQVGDLIDVGGKLGVVKEIGVRSSKINNNEGADIIIPNGDLLSQHLINWTMQDRNKQVQFMIGIPYQADLKLVKTQIEQTLAKNDAIMEDPAPMIMVQQFGDWAIDMKVLFWVHDLNEAGTIRSNAMVQIYETIVGAGIKLPVYKGPPIEKVD